MKIDKIIVFTVCITVAILIAIYHIRKIKKEVRGKGYRFVSPYDYDPFYYYKIWHCLGFIALALLYCFYPRTDQYEWFVIIFVPVAFFCLALFGRRIDRWETKDAEKEIRLRKFFNKNKESTRLHD